MCDFKDKVVLVTGANRGIGRSIAEQFAVLGANVAVAARSKQNAEAVAEELGGGAAPFVLDVDDVDSIAACVKAVLERWGKIDVLVNNAGITRDGLAMRMKEADWQAVIDSNLTGAFNCTKAVLRPMMKARSCCVVNISSVVAAMGNPGQPNYCAAKAGLEGLTRSLAYEYADRGLRFNAVAPGFISTHMTDALGDDQSAALMEKIPLKRLGTGEDVAKAVIFLASEDASYITGQVLHVNGGMFMG
ncbi:MAG: 3-oxoacyl-[acyl-carrier-protein] reductase [Deltaproteobacteria bacterium]|nr:MAG: 3-oxoacyl-[acyl-carrier-protein] reductase [Deltaproteobacteria bacterium]